MSDGPKHFHAPRRARVAAPAESGSAVQLPGLSVAEWTAFELASRFREVSSTVRFRDSAAYDLTDVATFIARSLRNRARPDATLTRATKLVAEFLDFTLTRDHPLPFSGEESLIAVAKWLAELARRGRAAPGLGRYSLRAYGEAL